MNVAEALLDAALDEVRFEFAMTRAEFAVYEANRAAADLHAALDDALSEARERCLRGSRSSDEIG
jgi:hypothetical protein